MQCPECQYVLSDFDKECPRCKNIKGKSHLNPYVQHEQKRQGTPPATPKPEIPPVRACVSCGGVPVPGSPFCVTCGAKMAAEAAPMAEVALEPSPAPVETQVAEPAPVIAQPVMAQLAPLVVTPCPQCNGHVPLEAVFCAHCGARQQAIRQHDQRQDQSGPSVGIGVMWVLTLMAWLFGWGGAPIGWLFDGVAVIIAIVLIGTGNRTNSNHGKAKLWLELLAFIVAFVVSASQHSQ